MNGLRVYIKPVSADCLDGGEVFYSRRAHGPYYRWSLEEKRGQWHSLRMNAGDLAPGELALARWRGVPSALQARLNEHYME
jgi:hypothetical protein